MGLNTIQRYVIFDGPEQRSGTDTRYFSDDGTSTDHRHRAAKFFTDSDAIAFAKQKNILLDGVFHYIGMADFMDFELNERSGSSDLTNNINSRIAK